MLLFGTGQKTPLTNTNPAIFTQWTQALYGVWDWNLSPPMAAASAPERATPLAGTASPARSTRA